MLKSLSKRYFAKSKKSQDAPPPPDISQIKMVIGLGNIGSSYQKTRHNAGTLCLDYLVAKAGLRYTTSSFLYSTAQDPKTGVYFVYPHGYMNVIGIPTKSAAKKF